MENLYQGKNSKWLDPRGVFVIQGKEEMRIWIGSDVSPFNLKIYLQVADDYIQLLQRNERAPQKVAVTKQSEEDVGFWKLFNLERAPDREFVNIPEWKFWFIDLEKAKEEAKRAPVVT